MCSLSIRVLNYRIKKGGADDMTALKYDITQYGIKQVELLHELRKRGYKVEPPQLSNAINGVSVSKSATSIVGECERIIKECTQ